MERQGNDFDKKEMESEERRENPGGGLRRDDAIHSRNEGGRTHVSSVDVPPFPACPESGFSLPWVPLLPPTLFATCYPLQMRRAQDTPLNRNLISSLRYFPIAQRREKISQSAV